PWLSCTASTACLPSEAAMAPTGGCWNSGMNSASTLVLALPSTSSQPSTGEPSMPRAANSSSARCRNALRSLSVLPWETTFNGYGGSPAPSCSHRKSNATGVKNSCVGTILPISSELAMVLLWCVNISGPRCGTAGCVSQRCRGGACRAREHLGQSMPQRRRVRGGDRDPVAAVAALTRLGEVATRLGVEPAQHRHPGAAAGAVPRVGADLTATQPRLRVEPGEGLAVVVGAVAAVGGLPTTLEEVDARPRQQLFERNRDRLLLAAAFGGKQAHDRAGQAVGGHPVQHETVGIGDDEYALRAERGGDRESRFHLRRVDLHGVEADLGRRQTAEPVLDQRCGPAVVVDEAAFGELRKCPGPQSGALFERFPVRAHLERIGHLTGAE